MENIKISFNPKQKHLEEIGEWMIEEKQMPLNQNGNWSAIVAAFENKKLIIATRKNITVGFYTISFSMFTISIDVAEVNPKFRKKGIGKLLLAEIIRKYQRKEIYAFHLFCAPESSQNTWKKLGFKYYLNNSSNDRSSKIEMYRIIKPVLSPKKYNPDLEHEVIEVWNDEPHKINNENPTWIWKLQYLKNTNILKKPIVHFGEYSWRIRWRKGNVVYSDCKYKWFDTKNEEFNCMVIKETPKLK